MHAGFASGFRICDVSFIIATEEDVNPTLPTRVRCDDAGPAVFAGRSHLQTIILRQMPRWFALCVSGIRGSDLLQLM
jgi:hypothetical protein